jgi:sec-independent protein translocase protein TatB
MNGFFGVGPFELLLIAILALIFIGPQRLPGVIQQVMRTYHELRNYLDEARATLTQELEPLREELENVTRDVSQVAQDMTASANEVARDIHSTANQAVAQAQQAVAAPPTGFNASPPGGLNAPPPPRDEHPLFPSVAPLAVHTNGVSHADDDEQPAFGDYRPS